MEIGTMRSDKMESNLAENRVDQGYTIYGMDVDSPLKVDVTKGKYGEKVSTSLSN